MQLYTHYYDEEKKQARPIEEYKGENPDEVRLAYVDYKPINRCPHCKTGLANEDLDDGKCERCGSEVEQRPMRQWVLRITKYADRLLEGLDALDWDESMKELERNWIGKSSGTQFEMNVKNFGELEDNQLKDCEDSNQIILRNSLDNFQKFFSVFTTRIDTVFGMSFVVMAPEHTLVDQITTPKYKDAVAKYKEQAKFKTQLERTELQKEKTGQFTGAYAINPFNNEEVPIFIGDYVLANYGTGVVMAVPAHDERDFEFAKKYDIPIRTSIAWDYLDQDNPPQEGLEMTERNGVIVLIKHRSEEKYLCLEWKTQTWKDLITGGIEEGEDPIEAAKREVQEET
ncbi:MAG: class I tRNA ligase family protein [Candidatus Peribacteria bacterium]|nr:class I tRNA ligase family protein [Candidatus Peribacteria bacterium]